MFSDELRFGIEVIIGDSIAGAEDFSSFLLSRSNYSIFKVIYYYKMKCLL
jgi:hypothetical protein